MQHYTIGALFNFDLTMVLLIQKNKPEWQRGKYNLPGGKVEPIYEEQRERLESPEECIEREMFEESELIILEEDWKYVGIIKNISKDGYRVHLLTHRLPTNDLPTTIQNTPEPTNWFPISNMPSNRISNLSWLIHFAKNIHEQGNHDVLTFGTFEYKFNKDGTTRTISNEGESV